MSIFFITVISIVVILGSKKIFGKWFNPVSLYTIIWGVMLFLFELKLIAFFELRFNTWLIIITAYASFLLGATIIFTSRSALGKSNSVFNEKIINPTLFFDNGRILMFTIYFLSIVGLASALQHWNVLINEYGSVVNVLINSYAVYSSRITGDEPAGIIPYLWLTSYFAAFLAGIYTAYKRRLTFPAVISLTGIALKESAKLTRAGILFGLFLFLISFVLTRHLLNSDIANKYVFKRSTLVVSVIVILAIMVSSATFIKVIRNPIEEMKGTSQSLSKFEGGAVISPTIYFYAASQVGVLNQYFEKGKENLPFGNATFLSVYNLLSKFNLVERPKVHSKGYFIPQWSNTATFLRDIHSDFGYAGLLLVPFLLGLCVTFYWFRFYETQKFVYLVLLAHLFVIIGMSFFALATRFPPWVFGITLLSIGIPVIEKFIINRISD